MALLVMIINISCYALARTPVEVSPNTVAPAIPGKSESREPFIEISAENTLSELRNLDWTIIPVSC